MKFAFSLSPIVKNKSHQAAEELRIFLRTMCVAQRRWDREIATFECHVRRRMIEEDHCLERLRRIVLRGASDQLKHLGTTDLLSCAQEAGGANGRRCLPHRIRPETFLLYDIAPSQLTPFSVYAMSRLRSNPSKAERDLHFYSSPSLIAEYQAEWAMLSPAAKEHYEDLALELRFSLENLRKMYGVEAKEEEKIDSGNEVESIQEQQTGHKRKRGCEKKRIGCKENALMRGMQPRVLRVLSSSSPPNPYKSGEEREKMRQNKMSNNDALSPSKGGFVSTCSTGTQKNTARSKKKESRKKKFKGWVPSSRKESVLKRNRENNKVHVRPIRRGIKNSIRVGLRDNRAPSGSSLSPAMLSSGTTVLSVRSSPKKSPALNTPHSSSASNIAAEALRSSGDRYSNFTDSLSSGRDKNRLYASLTSPDKGKKSEPISFSATFPGEHKLFENFLRSTLVQLRSSLGNKKSLLIGRRKQEQLTMDRWLPIALQEWNILTTEQKQLY